MDGTHKCMLLDGAHVNAAGDNKSGCTVLHYAASGNPLQPDTVQLLIANGADVNAKAKNRETPLHAWVAYGHKDIAELLLTERADVNAKDRRDRTPLQMAEKYRRTEIADLLHKRGAKE